MSLPKAPTEPAANGVVDESAIDAYAHRALDGKDASPEKRPAMEKKLRYQDPEMPVRIQRVLAARRVRVPANTWILEAIAERLEREEAELGLAVTTEEGGR